VQKEFFLLLTRDLLSPNFGMFRAFEDSNLIWFNESHLENQVMFYLVGVLLSIAIYNSTILSLPFPLALYKKLLGQKVGFEDFKELEPILAFSLEQLLEYTESDFEGFDLKFDYTLDVYGKVETVPLKKNGSDISVTVDNVQEYVDLLVDYKLNKSIDAQFSAFKDGFVKVCGTRILSLFHPEQLQEMVVGNQDYDWGELERNCNYHGDYNSNDSTVLLFWEVFHELSLDDKKQFLLFLTGSDRIPILGMKGLNMIIQCAGSENHLPVAHTCFNILDLPPYKTKEIMQLKLGRAIQNNVGFTLA
jgi:E3 ubiquitin-protein ligase HERC4